MSHPPIAIANLRAQGARVTPQREAILCALYTTGHHVTAETVYEMVSSKMPQVGLATVYRTLELFKSLGMVVATDLGDGCLTWELVGNAPHHHAICRVCGGTVELDHDFVAGLEERLRDELGFEADLSHLALFGTCAVCRNAGG